MIQRYLAKISGPLMDRIDIHIDVPAVNYKEMRSTSVPVGSAQIRERVIRARQIQLERLAASRQKIYCKRRSRPAKCVPSANSAPTASVCWSAP